MKRETPTARTFTGSFELNGPPSVVFPLFSPEGERSWVPGWDPETFHPPGALWEEEMLFRTEEETGDAIWIITRLDRENHHVIYHRVEPERWVARVEVTCAPAGQGRARVGVTYTFVGLSAGGNGEIAAMTEEAYAAKMQRWKGWIDVLPGTSR